MKKLAAQAVEQLQPAANTALRNEIRAARDAYHGETADQVYSGLVERLRNVFGKGFQPNEDELRKVAQAITEGAPQDDAAEQPSPS